MPKPELGTKRQCQNCGAKFFDLGKSPIVCPKCATVYQVAAVPARAVARAAPAKPVAEVEPEVEAAEVELVSLEEVEEGEDKVAAVAADDIEVEDEPADTFLEEEEEDSDDVSTLIDGDLEADEER